MKKLAFLVAFTTGCAVTYHPPPSYVPATQNYQAPFEEVWQATVRVLAERNFPMKNIDKSSGLIATESLTASIGSHIDCGLLSGMNLNPDEKVQPRGTGQGTFNLLVTKISEGETRVQINSRWASTYVERDLYGRITTMHQMECIPTPHFEGEIFGAIETGLRRDK